MKYLIAILSLAFSAHAAVDADMGRFPDLTWSGTGTVKVASFAAAPPAPPGVVTTVQNFSSWPTGVGPKSTNGWASSAGTTYTATFTNFSPGALGFINNTYNSFLHFPTVTNGIDYFECWVKSTTYTNVFCLQSSPDDTNWTTVLVLDVPTNYSIQTTNLSSGGGPYYRFFNQGKPAQLILLDDILFTEHP